MPSRNEDLPSTLERSPDKVKRTYEKTLDSAHEQYGSEERAHRAAWASVKNVAEKKGDHWELKGGSAGRSSGQGATKRELYERARELGISGRSKMSKEQLERAIKRES
jgi:cation transport regulator ChaB